MGTWVVETDESKEATADIRTSRVSPRAVQREEGVAEEGGGEETGPGQQRNWVGNLEGNSVLITENHAVDRMMRDPDQAGETGPEVGKLSELVN